MFIEENVNKGEKDLILKDESELEKKGFMKAPNLIQAKFGKGKRGA